ncbi:ribosomal protein S8A [Ascosphaera acerosa]|nr:ribosomal protein S8A [Ascosphaera acerosa]
MAGLLPQEEVRRTSFHGGERDLETSRPAPPLPLLDDTARSVLTPSSSCRAFEKGRQPANTRIGTKRIHLVRTRGGNQKFRALRLEAGNFSWGSEGVARKTRVIMVSYHPSNNELVRTNTLTKSAVVQIDAAPFRQWYEAHYGQTIGRKRHQHKAGTTETAEVKKSASVEKKQAARFAAAGKIEPALEKQFEAGRLFALISSRPGQSGRCDGYILEGEELAFYQRAIRK